jgi:hypothetical protein
LSHPARLPVSGAYWPTNGKIGKRNSPSSPLLSKPILPINQFPHCSSGRERLRIVVELEAVVELISDHEAQLFNYMRIARQPIGYLINFGHKGELQWKRFILSDMHQQETGNTNLH